ncbi:LacI family DNA-binding transcriptional regulator [Microbacterium sp. cx-55]|uniref:LacI family DNA-binding transcriptional regulator n=1 Tax=unclassified Microbacterium TaxID=2609290 RepID=UPI001CC168AC|nr:MULTISPECIES: LacI family DNA-binding transcriptional regulator [unclassified Microbacterium]MBZ4487226.1 LacI family DNA-binding transcriptional regulator [Microbacterium sp. cx-55]MCC4908656.1 LacI family DNA-binding transcriptional regulator [Microbacterium sp. cx-59]UGB35250.1 LacI family DNA-binding transcriptional regulator [Microbacterium sp. cx-55]
MNARRATIADVARVAGVAASTASVVFSGKTPVSESTRQRVLSAAENLGYTGPDPRAASLRRGRSGIVGVVMGDRLRTAFRDPVTTVMLDGLAEGVAAQGAGLLLLREDAEGGGPSLRTAPADAFVLVGCNGRMRESLDAIRGRGIPVVVIEGDAGEGVPQILLDNREAQAEIARHVRDLGHEDVVVVSLAVAAASAPGWVDPDAPITVDVTADRLRGARDVFPDARVYSASRSSIDDGYAAAVAVLATPGARPTAILAQSDLIAAGVIRAVQDAGLVVPDDISVTGFDGVWVDGVAPLELTTMVQPAADKGRAAGAAISAMLAGEPPATVHLSSTFRAGNTIGAVKNPTAPEGLIAP